MKKESFIQLTVVTLCLFLSSALADQHNRSVIYVDAVNGNDQWMGWSPTPDPHVQGDNNNGPKKTIRSALYRLEGPGGTVIVADGIYTGDGNISFAHILEDKSLTLRSANGPENCIIDCGAQDVPFQFLSPYNSQEPVAVAVIDGFTIVNARQAAVKFGSGSAATIANCILSGNWIAPEFGVITCRNHTTPSIINCTIENNTGENLSAGIKCINSAPIITGCSIVAPATPFSQPSYAISSVNALPTITGCSIARSTGIGIRLMSDDGVLPEFDAPVRISGCTLTNNVQTAIVLQADAEVSDCLISGNSAQLGAGIIVGNPEYPYPSDDNDGLDKIDVTVRGCTITDNIADSAPAMYLLDTNVKVNDCLIAGNYATSYTHLPNREGASAILGCWGNFRISNSVISDNIGEYNSGYALAFFDNPKAHIENSSISDNYSFESGGGLGFFGYPGSNSPDASLTVENCEILRNSGRWEEVNGIFAIGDSIRIANCLVLSEQDEQSFPVPISLFVENSDDDHFCDIVNCTILRKGNSGSPCLNAEGQGPVNITNSILWIDEQPNYAQVIHGDKSQINVSYSNVQDPYYADVVGNGNIIQAPLFADSDAYQSGLYITFGEDFHLKSQAGRYDRASDSWVLDEVTCPGVDGGDPSMHVGGEPLSSGGRINMGAYGGTRYASKSAICTGPIVGDLNNDCTVNLTDFANMAANWLESTIEQQ